MSVMQIVPPGGTDASLRVPPHNLHAEQAVLASVLLNNEYMDDVENILRPEDFYQGAHRILFDAMLALSGAERPIDLLTITAAIKNRGAEQQIGGLEYLAEIVSNVPLTDNAVEYAMIVKEKSILRKTIAASQEISATAFRGVENLQEFLDQVESRIFAVTAEEIKPKYFSMKDMTHAAFEDIERAFESKKRITGIPTGFFELDKITAGLQKSNMIVVAARPGVGKTALCLNIAVHAAMRHKIPVGIFSLEMSRQELAMRMICSEARVNSHKMRTGQIGHDELRRLIDAMGVLSTLPIYADDSGSLSSLEFRARARRLKKDQDIGLIIVDYLQMMRGSSSSRSGFENRVQEVSEISRGMKALAKELEIPVIAISQLSRETEKRENKRPQMADLRESGAIEQDSDLILFIYREEMHKRENTPHDKKGVAEIIVGKNRSGPMQDFELVYIPQYTRFENKSSEEEDYGDFE